MDFARRAAARADADDIYAMPNPSPDGNGKYGSSSASSFIRLEELLLLLS
jgi:hypothetical protein